MSLRSKIAAFPFKKYKDFLASYFYLYRDPRFLVAVFLVYAYLFTTYKISSEAGIIATRMAGPEIPDTLHSLLPKINTRIIHQDFSASVYYVGNYIFFFFPKRIIFAVFTLATLIITRAFFINLTHLGIPNGSRPIWSDGTFGGDLFFSGHVAYPFLLSLLFWDIKILRYGFIVISIVLGASALLGRYHYSIDVFAAPFITYGVFIICKRIFEYVK